MDLPWAHGGPLASARLRAQPEDFQVAEELGYEFEKVGPHWALRIRKRNLNTLQVAERLQQWAGVSPAQVGFAGLKDRRAVTTQWFSLQLDDRDLPDRAQLESEDLQLLGSCRASHKIRRGELAGNRFTILLRDLDGSVELLEARLAQLSDRGFPNYFGAQRFGNRGSNLQMAAAWMAGGGAGGRERRAMLTSALRAQLFNLVLAERVRRGNWERLLPGEVGLDPSGTPCWVFEPDASAGLDPSGPLPGAMGGLAPRQQAAALEREVLEPWRQWLDFLARQGVRAARRPLIVRPAELQWEWCGDDLRLRFGLPAGAYATSLLRELVIATALTGE